MKLNVMERLVLSGILPEKGDFATLKIMGKLKDDLSFSEKEHKDLSIKQVKKDGHSQILWNPTVDKGVEIEMGDVATKVIVDALTELDKKKELSPKHISVYEKFM